MALIRTEDMYVSRLGTFLPAIVLSAMLIVHTQKKKVKLLYYRREIIWLNEPVLHHEPLADAEQHKLMRKQAKQAPIPAYEDPFNIQWSKQAILVKVRPWNRRRGNPGFLHSQTEGSTINQ